MCVCVCVSICALILNHYNWLLTSLHSYAHTISTLRVYRLSCSYRTESYLCQYLPSEQPSYIISRNKVGDTFSFLHLHCPPPPPLPLSLSLSLSPSLSLLTVSVMLPSPARHVDSGLSERCPRGPTQRGAKTPGLLGGAGCPKGEPDRHLHCRRRAAGRSQTYPW